MLTTVAQVELAGALALAGAVRRYVELSFGSAESFANKLLLIARDPGSPTSGAWDRILAEAAVEYRDYVRGLAASPTLTTMSFFDQLERLRTTHPRPRERERPKR